MNSDNKGVCHQCWLLAAVCFYEIIDIKPFGKVRTLPEGAMQMFIRDPSGNLVEISSSPNYALDPSIYDDELYQDGMYDSGRQDFSGYKSADAKLYHSHWFKFPTR